MARFFFDHSAWLEHPTTAKAHLLHGKHWSDMQKQFLTPVALNTTQINELKSVYNESTRKLGFVYSVPMFNLSTSVKFKGATWMITSAGLIEHYHKHMLTNFSIGLPLAKLKTPQKFAFEVLDKHIKFWKGDCEDAQFRMIKIKGDNGLYYGYKIIDEYFPVREVK
jgi:hypothetical protein